jgi:ADP-ribose pyrophosphatase YjhB (NUDIX family)
MVGILDLLDEIRILALNGLQYTPDEHDRIRYQRLLELAAGGYEHALGVPASDVLARLSSELGHVTPKLGAEAAVIKGGRILLVQRRDDGLFCLPCGWVEPHESPEETAVREMREETGLEVRVASLVGVFREPAGLTRAHPIVSVLYRCEVVGGRLAPSDEAKQVSYWDVDDVQGWHGHHERLARAALEAASRGGGV